MKKIQFAVVLTEEKKTVLMINNDGIFRTMAQWQKRFETTETQVLYIGETDKIDISLSHYYM